MGLFGIGQWTNNGGGGSNPRPGGGLGKFISDIAPAVPIVGGVVSNILAGINERKARLYNSPANQIKRMQEAGLPTAAGSSIQSGGGVSTKVQDLGTTGLNDNLGKSITRNIDRKKLQIAAEELKYQKANANIKTGESDWMGQKTENYLGSIQTNQAAMLDFTKSIKESEEILKNNEQFISSIERRVKEELRDRGYLTKEVIAKVDQVLAQTGLINEQTQSLVDQRQAREVLLDTMRKNGMNIMEALTYMFVTKYMGTGQ